MTRYPSTYALAARHEKAFKLANRLRENEITAEEATQIKPEEWDLLAQAINVRPPSEETVRLVLSKLREWENEPLPIA